MSSILNSIFSMVSIVISHQEGIHQEGIYQEEIQELIEGVDVVVKESLIANAGRGVFSLRKITKGNFLCRYHGMVIAPLKFFKRNPSGDPYAFTVDNWRGKKMIMDASHSKHWSRFMNCSTCSENENVMVFEEDGEIYFEVRREIESGEELLFYYGDDYAKKLGANYKRN